jgi:hypothetical protein
MREMILAAGFAALTITSAHADQITLGNSPVAACDLAGTGSSHPLAMSCAPYHESALFQSDVGVASFGPEALATGPGAGGVFPVISQTMPGETLSILFGDGDHISGTVDWTNLNNGSTNPHIVGEFKYVATGDADFLGSYNTSGLAELDMIAETTALTLENWDTDAGLTWSSGEIVDLGAPLPEPQTLGLLAFGLLALWGWLNRNRRGSSVGLGGP